MLKLFPKLLKNSFIIFIIFVLLFSTTSFAYAVETRETEPNDTIVNANNTAVNSETVGNLSAIEDVDWYSFTIPSAGKVSLNIKHNIITGHSGAYLFKIGLYSYNADTQIETEIFTFGANSSGTSADSPNVGLAPGTYFIRISIYYKDVYTNTDYRITPVFVAETNREVENNNTMATANQLTLSSDTIGSIQMPNDIDWYTFTLPSSGKVSFSFKGMNLNLFWMVKLYAKDQDPTSTPELMWFYPKSTTTSYTSTSIGLSAGIYFLRISSYPTGSNSNLDYAISVNFTAETNRETEPNNESIMADQITTNTEYSGNISNQTDKDWYAFTMPYAGLARFSFKHTTFNNENAVWSIKVYTIDSSQYETEIAGYSACGSLFDSIITFKLPAGKLYIEILPASPQSYNSKDYLLTVNPFKLTAPQSVNAVSSSYNSIKLNWNPVAFAFGYTIFRSASLSGKYSTAGSTMDKTWTDTGRLTGKNYYYKIKAFSMPDSGLNDKDEYSVSSAVVHAKAIPSAPISVKATRASSSSIKLTWSPVTGATGYCVYRLNSSTAKFESIKVTSATNYVNSGLKVNNAYQYKIIAYRTGNGANVYGNFSLIVTAKTY
jgi:hypothetical protein